jgi:YD repeat-containing protein
MSIAMGEASTLSWQVVHADIVMIDHDVGEVFPNGSEVVTPQETTTYLLAAIGPGGTTSESVTVTVTQLPPTAEIEANPESIHTGESADLSWTSANADSCVIEPDIGVVDRQGWITLWPTETTSYTIVATGPGGTATDSIVVTVTNPAPAVEISADPDSIHLGESATLSWSSYHADSCVIEPDIGPVALTGSTTVWSNETTAYTITATGPGGTVTASATVVIANSAPVAHGQAVTTDEDTGASITLTGSDADGDPLTYSLVSPPIHGALAGTPPDLAYAPDPNFHGSDSFTFNANDGVMDSEPAVVAITVAAINDRPAAADDMAATDEDIPTTTANVLANDSDVDGDTLGVSSYTQPANGTVTSHGDGTFIYTPNPDFNGMDGFTYAAQDHEGAIDTAAVSVFVSPVNDAPAAQAGPDQPAMAGDTVWLDGSASDDVDGDTLAYQWSFVSMPEESGATLSDPSLVNPTFVVDVSGTYELQLVVHDGTVQSAPDTIIVTATPRIVEVPDILGLSQAEAQASILAADLAVGNSTAQNSETVPEGHVMSQNPAAGALAEEGSSVDLVISLGPVSTPPTVSISATPGVIQPGDSATLTWNSTNGDRGFMEPAMSPVAVHGSSTVFPTHTTTYTITVTGPFGSASAQAVIIVTGNPKPQPEGTFGEQYEDLVPSDATVESYNPGRFSLITGVVQDREGVPIAQTAVTIHGHPEYGTASTDAQGRFSIPVEGGATVTVSYQKAGLLGLHRKVYVQWNDIAVLEAVEMIPQDPASTTVTFDGNPDTVICHQSTAVTDSFGSRSCTMVFTGDTRAYLVDDSGNDVHELTTITTRATEFSSPGSMPARLPPNSAYTYCVEPIVDGVPRVRFDEPVIMWVDNFLGFAVGDEVPVGYYDRDRGLWVAYDNGTVVALLDTDTDGLVDALDAHGDGQADDLNGNGSFSDEVAGLDDPERYAPGASFWRVSVPHFTPWDCNWPYGPPSGATAPNASGIPQGDQQKEEALDCPDPNSSIVEQRSRIFHEDIPVAGTALTLHYASNRVEGYKALITVPASGDTVPGSLKRIVVKVNLAGRVLEQILDPICNQTAEIVWDGKDHLGRPLAGSTAATVSVGFVYDAMYYKPGDFAQAFAQAGTEITGIRARQEIISWKRSNSVVVANPKGTIAEGWTLSAHHGSGALVPETLYKGDGSTIRHNVHIIDTVAGDGTYGYSGDGQSAILAKLTQPFYVAVDAENNLFIADYFNHAIRKVDTDGIITTVANVSSPHAVALDAGGNLYIASSGNNRIYRVDTNGAVTPVAGTGMAGYSGDEGPATNAGLSAPHGVAIGPGGNLYIADSFNHRIRKVDTNGIITTVAGTGVSGYRGDGGPATDARLSSPQDIAVDRWGSLYIADGNNYRIRKVDTNGIIATLAGTGTSGFRGDGGPAIQARLDMVYAVATDGTGNLYIADSYNHRIRKVDTNGIITTVTGTGPTGWGQGSYSGDGGMAVDACLRTPFGVALNPAGHLYIADTDNYRIRKVAPPSGFMNVMGAGDMAFADEDGLGYVLNSAGQHKVTLDLDTGAILRQFIYDQNGQLISMADRFGSQITIDRDIDGLPVAIISPDGIMTSLSVDAKNHLSGIIYPDGSTFTFEYTEDGLMSAKVESEGNRFEHLFDATGRLTDATDDLYVGHHEPNRRGDAFFPVI